MKNYTRRVVAFFLSAAMVCSAATFTSPADEGQSFSRGYSYGRPCISMFGNGKSFSENSNQGYSVNYSKNLGCNYSESCGQSYSTGHSSSFSYGKPLNISEGLNPFIPKGISFRYNESWSKFYSYGQSESESFAPEGYSESTGVSYGHSTGRGEKFE